MPTPLRSAMADVESRAAAADKATAGPSLGDAENGDTLPARVVVELPDGGILLGEDSGRLRHEQPGPSSGAQPQPPRVGAQPGSEQWVELRRLLYATGLESLVLTRKRATSIILGVDLVYMLMAVVSIALRGIDTAGAKVFNYRIILALNIFGALLDCITIGVVVQQRRKAVRTLAIAHALLLLAIGPGSFIAIAIIRILLISFLFRLLAALVELQWVVGALPLSGAPRPAWLQSALLGVTLSSHRSEYFAALQQAARQSSREAAGGGTEVNVHTVQLGTYDPASAGVSSSGGSSGAMPSHGHLVVAIEATPAPPLPVAAAPPASADLHGGMPAAAHTDARPAAACTAAAESTHAAGEPAAVAAAVGSRAEQGQSAAVPSGGDSAGATDGGVSGWDAGVADADVAGASSPAA